MQTVLAEAGQFLKAGQPRDALAVLEPLVEQNIAPLRVHSLAASARLMLGDTEGALRHLAVCEGAIGRTGDSGQARLQLATQFARAGTLDKTHGLVREAIRLEPDNLQLHARAGDLLGNHGRWADALAIYRSLLHRMPDSAPILASAGIAADHAGDRKAAVDYYLAALRHDPGQVHVYNNLLAGLIEQGRVAEALEYARRWLKAAPADIEAMAFMSLVEVETGHRDAAQPWFDYDRLVSLDTIAPPAGYDSLDQFNRDLERTILAQPDLKTPPPDHPTWHHPALKIGPDINRDGSGPIKALEGLMYEAVERYFAQTGDAGGHPFLEQRPRGYRIYAWSAVLEGEGNQQPHIHMDGYLSGCYYVTIPDEVAKSDDGLAGGFQLGRPPRELPFKGDFPIRTIRPHEGLMVLFPAYLYHGTVPFRSEKRRISIAFDVVPEQAA